MAITMRTEVMNSATGKASQTPVMPKRAERSSAQRLMATKPRSTEVMKAQAALSVALKKPVPMMLKPAKRKPVK